MNNPTLAALLLAGALILAACSSPAAASIVQAACPMTKPNDPLTGLHGPRDALHAFIPKEGVWNLKAVMWKYPGYDWIEEPVPAIQVVVREYGGDASFEAQRITNAYAKDLLGSAMLTGIRFPHAGCWEITGSYRDSQLTFITWVAEDYVFDG